MTLRLFYLLFHLGSGRCFVECSHIEAYNSVLGMLRTMVKVGILAIPFERCVGLVRFDKVNLIKLAVEMAIVKEGVGSNP